MLRKIAIKGEYSNSGVAIAFRSNRNRKVRSIESRSKSKFHAIAMLIRSEIPIDRKFLAITVSVVSVKGTTPPKTQIRVLIVESVAPRKNEPKVSVHPQETIMRSPRNAGCKTTKHVRSICPNHRTLLARSTPFLRYAGPIYTIYISYIYTLC